MNAKKTKMIVCLALSVAMLMSVMTGCALDEQKQPGQANVASPTDTDTPQGGEYVGNTVIGKVGDIEITYAQYTEMYNYYLSFYSMYGYDPTTDVAQHGEFQMSVVDSLVEEAVMKYHVAKNNIADNLSAEQQKDLDDQIKSMKEEFDTYFRGLAEEEAASDATVNVEERMKEIAVEEAKTQFPDENLTYEQYADKVAQQVKDSVYSQALKDFILKDLTVNDADVKAWYDEHVETLKSEYAEDPTLYKSDADQYEMYGGEPVTYRPAGGKRMMHIQVMPDGALSDDYAKKTGRMSEIVSTYGELSIAQSNGEDHAAELKALLTEYNTLKTETETEFAEFNKVAETKINEAYAKLVAGGDIAAITKQYTQDSVLTSSEESMKNGVLYSADDANYSAAIHEAFSKLTVGKFSEVFKDDDGYHIVCYYADETEGPVPFDDVKDAIKEYVLLEKQDEEWTACVDAWMNDSSVQIYKDVLTNLGIGSGAVG